MRVMPTSPRARRRGGGTKEKPSAAAEPAPDREAPIAEHDREPASAGAAPSAPAPASLSGSNSNGTVATTAAASLAVVASKPSRPGGVPLGNEWFLRNGRGKLRTAAAKDGGASITTVSNVVGGAFYLATFEPSGEDLNECIWRGSYQIDVSVKCVREPANPTPSFYIVADAQLNAAGSPENFCVFVLDTKAREVRIERFTTSGHEMLAHSPMPGLRPGIWYRVHAEIHAKCVKVCVNGEELLDGVELDAGGGGLLGLALYESKGQFRGWEVKQLNAAMMRRQYTGDDDPKLVEMIERDIISQVRPSSNWKQVEISRGCLETLLCEHALTACVRACQDVGVTFDEIAALEQAKQLLNEAVVLPLVIPEFFVGIRCVPPCQIC